MSSPVAAQDAQDFPAHQRMWIGYTKFMTRGVIGVVVTVVIIGFITGVL